MIVFYTSPTVTIECVHVSPPHSYLRFMVWSAYKNFGCITMELVFHTHAKYLINLDDS